MGAPARGKRRRSAASWLFVWVAAVALTVAVLAATGLLLEAHRATRSEAERVTQAVAETLAHTPIVRTELAAGDRAAATAVLQPFAEDVMSDARVDFVTIMEVDGTRVTHPDRGEIGGRYLGTIPAGASTLTEEFTGTLGTSLRTVVAVDDDTGARVGWVSVGVTVQTVAAGIVPRVLIALGVGLAVAAAGLAGAVLARVTARRFAGDLPAGAIRDTLASAESLRTLGEALRAQTHEHGNRMHTAVALIELGRADDAIRLLTDSARQSQILVDQVAARTQGDPTVGALLLGKASQASERGIAWTAQIDPDAPRSLLAPLDQVALVGNLIDNALDAAAAEPEPRWVRVVMARTADDELRVEVSDSGSPPTAGVRARMFERGFSTKPAGADGRGVGLALVAAIVDGVGGTVTLDAGAPTTFRVILPTAAS